MLPVNQARDFAFAFGRMMRAQGYELAPLIHVSYADGHIRVVEVLDMDDRHRLMADALETGAAYALLLYDGFITTKDGRSEALVVVTCALGQEPIFHYQPYTTDPWLAGDITTMPDGGFGVSAYPGIPARKPA